MIRFNLHVGQVAGNREGEEGRGGGGRGRPKEVASIPEAKEGGIWVLGSPVSW